MNETAASPAEAGAHPHDDHDHPAFLAHHFESPKQQFDAGKLGMWLFLITEVLFFSGLFVAYAVYRARHPEVFADAHQYLDKTLGAVNTVVLLFSSLTMAWGVRCAQTSQRRGLVVCLITTLACASFFLGIKAIEYSHKWELGLYWAGRFHPHFEKHVGHGLSPTLVGFSAPAVLALIVFSAWTVAAYLRKQQQAFTVVGGLAIASAAFFGGVGGAMYLPALVGSVTQSEHGESHADGSHEGEHGSTAADEEHAADSATHESAAAGKAEPVSGTAAASAGESDAASTDAAEEEAAGQQVSYAGIFFSIYYAMTGVHALHILAGMGVIAWLLFRSVRGDFSSEYFGPVDYVGLYWHLVDLVWIYLFPLLYLIH